MTRITIASRLLRHLPNRTRLQQQYSSSSSFSSSSSSSSTSSSSVVITNDVENSAIYILTLNTPTNLNAMTVDMGQGIESAVSSLSQLSPTECKAVIITGAGRAFSAGGDVSFLDERKRDTLHNNTATMMAFYKRFLSIRTLPVPTIACINGPAMGAGLCFAMATDIRVTHHAAKLGYTFVTLGLHPGMGGTYYTALGCNSSQVATRLLLTGDIISGAEAAALGLVTSSHATSELAMTESLAIARKIANQSPMAIRSTIRTIRAAQDVGLHAALLNEATEQAASYSTKDYAEGLDALRDKRPPNFPGE